ncbi:MAG: hypothetical protein HW390_2571 [Candidatus Brocadiaceae bacterium]|nr:hypothetical protein [Candidatus Brocadiaceae bacterium]
MPIGSEQAMDTATPSAAPSRAYNPSTLDPTKIPTSSIAPATTLSRNITCPIPRLRAEIIDIVFTLGRRDVCNGAKRNVRITDITIQVDTMKGAVKVGSLHVCRMMLVMNTERIAPRNEAMRAGIVSPKK